jgi:hypothetical protein
MDVEEECKKQEAPKPALKPLPNITVKDVVSQQNYEGYWSNLDLVASIIGLELAQKIQGQTDMAAVITYLIWKWLEKYHSGA